MGAQFRTPPSLERVASLFEAATALPLTHGAIWTAWSECPSELIEQFRPYIRPSHQQLLDTACANPSAGPALCSFLRQLLRPHHYKIEATRSGWRLMSLEHGNGAVLRKDSPVKIDWA
jgi:hypothetical protein